MNETFTHDGFLGGRVRVRQMADGFRAGMDTVMLAASIPARKGDDILELGSGAGIASLCLAARVTDCTISGVEVEADLVALANSNAGSNAMQDRVRFFEADVFKLPADLRREFSHVFCNPPFHDAHVRPALERARQRATHDKGKLADWLTAGLRRVAAKGTFTAILRADRLQTALATLPATGVNVFPLWPKPVEPAKRVIVQLHKGSRAQSVILPGLVLHDDDGKFTPEADAILHGDGVLKIEPAG